MVGEYTFYSFRAPATERDLRKKITMMGKMFPRKADGTHRKRQSEFKVRFLEASLGEAFFKSLIIIFYFWKLNSFHNSTGRLKSLTREKLLGGSAELDLVVYPVGQVCLLACPRLAEAVPRGDSLRVLGQPQRLQDVHGSWMRRREGKSQGSKVKKHHHLSCHPQGCQTRSCSRAKWVRNCG